MIKNAINYAWTIVQACVSDNKTKSLFISESTRKESIFSAVKEAEEIEIYFITIYP